MIRIGHFVSVLLPVASFQEVGRVCVDQDIWVIKPRNQIHRWTVFDLHSTEPLCRLFYVLRCPAPIVSGVGRFPALNIIFPADLFSGSPESMAHHHPSKKVHRPLEAVCFGVLRRPGPFIDLSRIWSPVDRIRQPLRVFSYPVEEVYHIPVQIVDRLDGAPLFCEKHRPAPEEWLQIAVVGREVFYDPWGQRPLCARIFEYGSHSSAVFGCAHPKVRRHMFAPLVWWA